jgi:DNA-directed RNA polymerase subunit E'/Rpb7
MDPLFERRTLTKKVNIHSKSLQKNIQASLLAQLKMQYQGRCSSEGYVHKSQEGIVITNYSLGRANYLKGGVDYDVTFQADICLPHVGQTFKAPVTLKSKIGIHAKIEPIEVLLPRDLHIGVDAFEAVKEGDEVEFEVIGSKFKQGDEVIVVVGRLKAAEQPLAPAVVEEAAPVEQEGSGRDDERRVIVTTSSTAELPKRRKLKRADTLTV